MAIGAFAGEVNFDFAGNEFNLPTTTNTSDSKGAFANPVVKENIKMTFIKDSGELEPLMWFSAYNNSTDLRCYAGNSYTIASTNGEPIISIAYTLNNGNLNVSTPIGTWEGDDYSTWVGEAASVTFAVGGKTQIKAITVTTKSGAVSVSAPLFNPSFTELYQPTAIEITTPTVGASIFYTTDGSVPTKDSTPYASPFVISTPQTVKAVAIFNEVASEISIIEYTFPSHQVVNSVAQYIALSTDEAVRIDAPLTVTYQSGKYLYLRDNTGSIQVYAELNRDYNNGDVIPAGIVGMQNVQNGTLQLLPVVATFKAPQSNAPAHPYEISVSQVDESLVNNFIKGKKWTITITKVGNKNEYMLSDDSGSTLPIYEKFKNITMPTTSGLYDVTGIVNLFNGTLQLYPTLIEQPGSGVSESITHTLSVKGIQGAISVTTDADMVVEVYSLSGVLCKSATIGEGSNLITMQPGLYIMKTPDSIHKVIVK